MMLVDEFRTAAATLAHTAASMPIVARRMSEMRSGYPSKTVGASSSGDATSVIDSPPPDDDDDDENPDERDARTVHLTQVERDALAMLGGKDRVDADTIEIRELLIDISAKVHRLDTLTAPYRLADYARAKALTEAPKDWCTSCYRDNQHHEPVGLKRDGTAYYEGLCRWCGDFLKAHGVLPTRSLLEHRHTGRRVTEKMVEAAIRRGARP